MLPREAMQAAHDLRATYHFPVHWGMFELALHDWDDPIRRLTQLSDDSSVPLLAPQLGEMVQLPGKLRSEAWWTTVHCANSQNYPGERRLPIKKTRRARLLILGHLLNLRQRKLAR